MGDLIGFGTRTFNIDETDENRYIYRLDQRNEYIAETIDLVTDSDTDPNPDPDPVSDDSRSSDAEVVELSLSSGSDSDSPDNYNARKQNVFHADDEKTWRSYEPMANGSEEMPPNHFVFSCENSAAPQSDIFNFGFGAHQTSSQANLFESTSPPPTTNVIDSSVMKRLELLKQQKKEAAEAKLINAQPLRKRRQTLVDNSCSAPSFQASTSIAISLQERATRLAEIGEKERVAREEAERLAAAKRVRVQPKVKQTHRSRGDKLAETMLNTGRN